MAIGFQSVQKAPASGIPGGLANLHPIVPTTFNYVSGQSVKVGGPVWPATHADGDVVYKVNGTTSGTDKPIGFVLREQDKFYPNLGLRGGPEGTLEVLENQSVTVCRNADLWAVAKTNATERQKVFAHKDGSGISTGAAGATISGAIETNWSVSKGGPLGSPIIISYWGDA